MFYEALGLIVTGLLCLLHPYYPHVDFKEPIPPVWNTMALFPVASWRRLVGVWSVGTSFVMSAGPLVTCCFAAAPWERLIHLPAVAARIHQRVAVLSGLQLRPESVIEIPIGNESKGDLQ